MKEGHFKLAQQVNNVGYYAEVLLHTAREANSGDFTIRWGDKCDRKYRDAVAFGVAYAWESIPASEKGRAGVVVTVESIGGYPDRHFHLLADSTYGGQSVLLELPDNCELTSRLLLDARLYQAPPPKTRWAGRPRKRGQRLPSPRQMLQGRCRHIELDLYGRHDRSRIAETVARVHAAPDRPLKGVAVQPLSGGREVQAFYSTVLQVSSREMRRNGQPKVDLREDGTWDGDAGHLLGCGRKDTLRAMPRRLRHAPGGLVYHVLNRANARAEIFADSGDYAAFERTLRQALERLPLELFAGCLLPNHWHLVLRPKDDGDLSQFMRWLTLTHTHRWHMHRHSVGNGHLYQGRFKSFSVETDEHFLTVCRYVERNALRAGLAEKAEDWRWGSLWRRMQERAEGMLSAWPVAEPADWVARVNRPQSPVEEEALQRCIRKGRPYGSEEYEAWTAEVLGLESAFRERDQRKAAREAGWT